MKIAGIIYRELGIYWKTHSEKVFADDLGMIQQLGVIPECRSAA